MVGQVMDRLIWGYRPKSVWGFFVFFLVVMNEFSGP